MRNMHDPACRVRRVLMPSAIGVRSMSRIVPLTPIDAPAAARPHLESLTQRVGRLSRFYATLAHAPAALDGFLLLKGALEQGSLAPPLRERLAVRVAALHGCDYCLRAHAAALKRQGVDVDEVLAAREGASTEPRAQAILRLTDALVAADARGLAPETVAEARAAGVTDAELLEAAAHVALNTFSNLVNLLAQTELDVPPLPEPASPST